MINLWDEFINNAEDKCFGEAESQKEYNEESEKYHALFYKIKGLLTEDEQKLIFEIDSIHGSLETLKARYMFRKGLHDGMTLFKMIKGLSVDKLDQPKSMYDRTGELLNEYREEVTGSLECREDSFIYDFIKEHKFDYQNELLHFIYENAFEDGKKQGYIDALS